MAEYDLVIRNGTVVTAADTQQCDVGIKDGIVATLGRGLAAGAREIDARGKLVLPGAIDSHCHIEQRSSAGVMCADDFYSAHGRRRVRRHDDGDPVRRAASRPVVAPGGRGISRGRAAQGGHRLRLPPDHLRPYRAGAGPGIAGADPGRLHLVQGLHDLRPVAPQRPPDARHPGAGAARGRDGHGARRKPRHDLVARRPAARKGAGRSRATTRSRTPGSPRARRPTAPSRCRNCSTCRS